MKKLIEILEDIKPGIDYSTCTSLIDSSILDSFDIISLVGELNDEFDVDITADDLIPENFNSAKAIMSLIESKK